jgi:integrase
MSSNDATRTRFERRAVPHHPGVFWRTKNGSTPTKPYQAIYRNGEGRQISRSGFGKIGDADAWLAEQRANRARGIVVRSNSMTVREWGERWIANHATLTDGSRRLNEQRLRDYVYPVIGQRRLGGANGISKHDVLAVKRSMEAEPVSATSSRRRTKELSANTIKGTLSMMSAMFQAAVDEDRLGVNPVRQLGVNQRKPRGRGKRPMVILEQKEIVALIRAAAGSGGYFGPMIATAIYTGMRLGELAGLVWADVRIHGIDRDAPYLVVRGQLLRGFDDTGRRTFGRRGLKSKGDEVTRQIRIPPSLADRLRTWRAASPSSTDDDFVFVTAAGLPPSDSTVRANFYRARDLVGIDRGMSFHNLRDTHASMLFREGSPITEVAARLGHTDAQGNPNPATTLQHYAHLFDSRTSNDEMMERLEARASRSW